MASPSSLSPPVVPMELHAVNRKKLLHSFRDYLSLSSLYGFIFLQGGEEQTRHCTDHTELFRQESYFSYLFGVQEPEFYGAIDIASGDSILFAPRLPAEYAVWLGEIKPLSHFKERYMVSSVFYTDEIAKVLHQQYQVPGKPLLYLLHGLNTDSNNFSKPADFKGIDNFDTDLKALHPILTECRVIKSTLELAVIQFANDISSEAHVEVMRKTKAGMKEYQLESLFLHHTYMYGGCRHCSYTCICATGSNSSTLHYGHAAAPNDRTLEDGDMALLDMGAEYHCYGSDITCSFPVNGKFTGDQSLVYNAVLHAHDAVISNMRPGVSWVDMHKLAERVILESLKEGDLLLGDVDAMVQERVGAVFLPHGLGHLLGIDTHDPGGYLKGAERPKEPGLKSLRTSRELLEGMVITVEPGCYFIDALLLPAMENAQTSNFFNHEQISRFRGFGGVRIESDVFVTSDGCVNMTKCPREIKDIEAVMAGAPWPINKACKTGESPTGMPKFQEKNKEVVFKGSYTTTETNVLVRMWIDTNIDPGNNQKCGTLWSRINKQYRQLIPDPTRTRMNGQLKSHFHRVGRAVKAFKTIHDKNMSEWGSDTNDLDLYMRSLHEYKQQKGSDFKYKEALDLLSRTPRFWEVEPGAQSSTSKKGKAISGCSFTSKCSNAEPEEGFERPQGVKAAKRKEKTKKSTNVSQVIENLYETKKLHLDLKMFTKDKSRMNPEQLTVYMKVYEEIKARRGW